MSIYPRQFSFILVLLLIGYGISFNWITPISVADDIGKMREGLEADSLFISCSPEKPVALPNESIQLKAWATTLDGKPFPKELTYIWSVSAGNISGKTAEALWHFENLKPGNYVATVRAATANKEAECKLQVVIEPDEAAIAVMKRGMRRETGRSFLLPQQKEHTGYGLYSYLLLGGPPSDSSRERYVKVVEAYLIALPDIARLERHFAPSELNITYLPVDAAPPNIVDVKLLAKWVLDHYDYARARYLLRHFSGNNRNGPYLASILDPLGGSTPLSHSLFQNLSSVPPQLAGSWIKEFMNQAAQEHFWETKSLSQLRLKVRSVIAILSMALPEVRNSLDSYIKLAPSLSPQ